MTSAFRRSVVADVKKKTGGSRSSFFERYKIPVDVPTSLMLLQGQHLDPNPPAELIELDAAGHEKPVYSPYFKVRMHKKAAAKNGKAYYPHEVCSRGTDPHNPQPCAPCDAIDSGDRTIQTSDMFAMGILHLSFYHRHPLLDRTRGDVVRKKDGSGPVMIFTECAGRGCNFCKVMAGQPPVLQKGDEPFPSYSPHDLSTI